MTKPALYFDLYCIFGLQKDKESKLLDEMIFIDAGEAIRYGLIGVGKYDSAMYEITLAYPFQCNKDTQWNLYPIP